MVSLISLLVTNVWMITMVSPTVNLVNVILKDQSVLLVKMVNVLANPTLPETSVTK